MVVSDRLLLDPYQPPHIVSNCHQYRNTWMRGSTLAAFTLLLLPAWARQYGRTSWCSPPPGVAERTGWTESRRVSVRVCVFLYVLGDGGGSFFVAVTQVRRGFPRCYFLLTLGFVLVSHHMLWLVLSFEGVGPQHNSISPHRACQNLFSFQAWGFRFSEWVSMSPCFHFSPFMSMPRSVVYPHKKARRRV